MKVISLVNQKGGVAKTTTAAALADYFARHGKKTLLIDFDPQGSLTTSFSLEDNPNMPQALKFLAFDKGMPESEVIKLYENLYIVTSDIGLEQANTILAARFGKERFLRRAIEKITQKEKFDYVILDSNPSFSQLTINVIYASDYVLVPFKPEFNSFNGIKQLFDNIEQIKDLLSEVRRELDVLGFVITMARQTKSSEEAIEAISKFAAEQNTTVFQPAIRLAVAAADAPSYGQSIYAYKPNSGVAQDYEKVSGAVLEKLEGK